MQINDFSTSIQCLIPKLILLFVFIRNMDNYIYLGSEINSEGKINGDIWFIKLRVYYVPER
jgi:hypothetical protein